MKSNKSFPKYTLFKTKKYKFSFSFDTFRTAEGNDTALCNAIRLICLWGTWYLIQIPKLIVFPLMLLCMVGVGITEVDYFKNKRKSFEWRAW